MQKPRIAVIMSAGMVASAYVNIGKNLKSNFISYFDLQIMTHLIESELKKMGVFSDLDFDPVLFATPFYNVKGLKSEGLWQAVYREEYRKYVVRHGDTMRSSAEEFVDFMQYVHQQKERDADKTTAREQAIKLGNKKHFELIKVTGKESANNAILSNMYYIFNKPQEPAKRAKNLERISKILADNFKRNNINIDKATLIKALKNSINLFQEYGLDKNNYLFNKQALEMKKMYEKMESQEADLFEDYE